MCVGESMSPSPFFLIEMIFKIQYIHNVPALCLVTCVFVDLITFQRGFEAMNKKNVKLKGVETHEETGMGRVYLGGPQTAC